MESNSKLNINHSTLQKSSKIFVAGGTGLVGSAIIKNLLDKGYTLLPSMVQSADESKVKNFLTKKLSDYKLPKYYEFREQLPKNESGKIIKKELS